MAKYPRPSPTTERRSMERKSKKREFYENLTHKIRRAGLIRHHQVWTLSHGIKLYKDSFKGEDFVLWLMRSQSWSRNEALEAGQCLMDHRLIDEQTPGWARDSQHQQQGFPYVSTMPAAMNLTETPSPTKAGSPPGFSSLRSFSTERYYKLSEDEDQKVPLNQLADEEEDNAINNKDNVEFGKTNNGTVPSATVRTRARPVISVREYNARACALLQRIYALVLSEDRRRIHLDLLDDCELFDEYKALSLEANFVDVASASTQERLAFFINMHNAMLMHVTYKLGPPITIWQRRKYLYSVYYNIGGQLYSLQSIFNGVLRGNRKGLGMLWKPFGDQDLRKGFIIDGGEPLVHFGLNNYTRSTAPIRTYSVDGVYDELRANARECLASKEFLQVDAKGGQIRLAKLFKQYADDFGPYTEDALGWILRVMGASEERIALAKMLAPTNQQQQNNNASTNYTVSYLPMDVDLNVTYGLNTSSGGEGEGNGEMNGRELKANGGTASSSYSDGRNKFNSATNGHDSNGNGYSNVDGMPAHARALRTTPSMTAHIELENDDEEDEWEEGE